MNATPRNASHRRPVAFVWEESPYAKAAAEPVSTLPAPAASTSRPAPRTPHWEEIHGPRSGKPLSLAEKRARKFDKAGARRKAELLERFEALHFQTRRENSKVLMEISGASDFGAITRLERTVATLEQKSLELISKESMAAK